MGITYWIRISFMCLSLAGIIYLIHTLQTGGLNDGFARVMGVERTARVLEHPRVDLCETRVHSLKTQDGTEVYENGRSWFLKKGANQEKLEPVAMEKWLGRNCSVTTEDLRQVALSDSQAATPVLVLDFIQGGTEAIRETPSGRFIWKQISFHSEQLESALKQLTELHPAPPHSH